MPGIVFGSDGVLAETELDGHLPAFNATFEKFGLSARWSEERYGELLAVRGGKERMASLWEDEKLVEEASLPRKDKARQELLARWHKDKTKRFKKLVAQGKIRVRPGVARLAADAAEAGWSLAVASASAEGAARRVLEHVVGVVAAKRFEVLAGDVVPAKKPDPGIYKLAIERLGLPPEDVLVIEDSRPGLLAADGAGLRCLITVSYFTRDQDFSEAAGVVTSLGDEGHPAEVLAGPKLAGPVVTLVDVEAYLR
jgi:HAD superfamily hydrolase (TIGR01509 family)